MTIRDEGNELARGECLALTGGLTGADGVAYVACVQHIVGAAFVRHGVRVLAEGIDLDDLVAQVPAAGEWRDGFRIDFVSVNAGQSLRQRDSIIAVANAMGAARPDLHNPNRRLLLVEQASRVWLGDITVEPDRSYELHDDKPHRTSSSLPSRLARALVNLAGTDVVSIVDPCCGTGSILLEACRMGLRGVGADNNPRMVGMSEQNLARFGYNAPVALTAASELQCDVDAVVTDLPYGRNLETDPDNIASILRACARLASTGVFAAGEDISASLVESGYADVLVYPVRKSRAFTRYIHLARRP
ncbi:MAG: hypothetical protein ABGY41_07425 [Candidatus Poribacteria bacterium]